MRLITLIIGLLVVGCGEVENGAYKHRPKQTDTNESTPTTNTNKVNGTTAKPVKELTLEEKVVGTYEIKAKQGFAVEHQITGRYVILENGIVESYRNDPPSFTKSDEHKWKIVDGDIHVKYDNGAIDVYRINKDGSLNGIALIEDGKRTDTPKEFQNTYIKIK
mgnify:CR=1 FL=1